MAQIRFATFTAKAPLEKKSRSFKWSPTLRLTGDTIVSSVWEITGVGLTVSVSPPPSFDAETTTASVEGGTAGTDYVLLNRITTAQGWVHEGSAIQPCRSAA